LEKYLEMGLNLDIDVPEIPQLKQVSHDAISVFTVEIIKCLSLLYLI